MKTVLKTAAGKNVFLCALLAALCFTSCGGESKVVKYLRQDINDSAARYWASFVEENGINAIDEDGDTLLYYAVEKYNDAHLVELCLNAKADCTLQPRGRRPLIDSAFKNFNPEVLALLFKHGVSVRGDKYDLLRSVFYDKKTAAWANCIKFLLPYYTEEQMDYRNYVALNMFSHWGGKSLWDTLIEMDKKGGS